MSLLELEVKEPPYFIKEELLLAYRKAKVDLYYSTNPPLLEMADYEEKLDENLNRLLSQLNSENEQWYLSPRFLGDWTIVPKAFEEELTLDNNVIAATSSKHSVFASLDKCKAEFRLMAKCSIDFHVVSSLWMMLVGEQLERQLSKNAYGSRLRRSSDGNFNEFALGSFEPYLYPFRKWQSDATDEMQAALKKGKNICALTADVNSFYHSLDAKFLENAEFLKLYGLEQGSFDSQAKNRIHKIFTQALVHWAQNTPLEIGLPVGLPASAVVANLALIELDRYIEQEIAPLHYGRYVDDIILVFENTKNLNSIGEVWKWLFERDKSKKFASKATKASFKPGYLKGSAIDFENKKNKLFLLSDAQGKNLITAINKQIQERASEWRALPLLPENEELSAQNVLKAISHQCEQVDNLRKADDLAFQRASFAVTLKNYEAFERDLPANAWQKQRHAFFDAVLHHLFEPKHYFELHQYLPRIVSLATTCEDFEYIKKFFNVLVGLLETVAQSKVPVALKGIGTVDANVHSDIIGKWHSSSCSDFITQFIASFPVVRADESNDKRWQTFEIKSLFENDWFSRNPSWAAIFETRLDLVGINTEQAQKAAIKLFAFDLANKPLRFSAYPKILTKKGDLTVSDLTDKSYCFAVTSGDLADDYDKARIFYESIEPVSKILNCDTDKIPSGFVFPTRPFGVHEFYLINQNQMLSSDETINQLIKFWRGFQWVEARPRIDGSNGDLFVSAQNGELKTRVAVASWKVSERQFEAAARNQYELSLKRYNRLNRLVNHLLTEYKKPAYFVLPELAIPAPWFIRIAHKLKSQGISLIAGVEYLHGGNNIVHNQVWMSLIHEGLGFPSLLIYRQDKQTPAIGEEKSLNSIGNLLMKSETPWDKPPVICHNGLYFSSLVCSELTNIHYRAHLSGKVDALFVLEWNQDINTFNALVESAALDIHAYIVQCNNRLYGDSRIRAPYKEDWKRDVLRVKGGTSDYFVIGKMNIKGLRQFQSYHRPPEKAEFKPKPDGFEQADYRKP